MNRQKLANFCNQISKKDWFRTLISSLWCVLIGLIIGFICLLIINANNAFSGMATILKNNFAFEDGSSILYYLGQTLGKTAPTLVMGVAIAFAYKAGLFNIGGSGQYAIGAICSLYASLAFDLPWIVGLILAFIGGALVGAISGLLKAYFNVNEVISGILLNWICLYMANWALTSSNKIWDSSGNCSYTLSRTANGFLPTLGLDKLFADSSMCGIGLIIAILIAIIVFIIFKKTTFGYQLTATGLNRNAAKSAGIPEKRNIILTTLISGGLAGLAAGLYLQNGYGVWSMSSVTPTIGFDGISTAFLGGLSPIGIIFSSYFITHIQSGGGMITDLGYDSQTSNLIVAIIIYASGFISLINYKTKLEKGDNWWKQKYNFIINKIKKKKIMKGSN